MCVNCIRTIVDITEGIPKQATIHYCKSCGRYLQPPAHWLACDFESRELLALCLKKLKGLGKVRLIDAGFIWTEPHSRRIKVKLTIQKEVFAATILQQTFEVEFIVGYQQCPDCMRVMAQNTWKAMVQIRQKVDHQRTFFYLEQLILRHNAHVDTINIKEVKGGLDFHFAQRSHAIKMVEFLANVVPTRSKSSERLISTDIHNNTSNYKFTYSVEIVPICKDDLIPLPRKLANSLGNISPLVLCSKVGSSIQIIDFRTLQTADISSQVYWRTPGITCVSSIRDLKEFYVMDVELLGPRNGRFALADVTIQKMADVGRNDDVLIVRSHLGNILNFGDTVLGYDLTTANVNNDNFANIPTEDLPSVVLVKKSYGDRRRKRRNRNWKLKQLSKEEGELVAKKQEQEKLEADFEQFMRDLEEDPDYRQNINLYKTGAATAAQTGDSGAMDEEGDDDDDEYPDIPLEELLEDLNLNGSSKNPNDPFDDGEEMME
ncbi:ribosome-binding protein [Mycoemilia scoparia]|uniref:60S ribosomal export protein NMD3 n=1 Tax=Mycoemilia scoparia TaxID=417184 RepID=A0A9W8A0C9_9FUNG|nr:ribosome-binding protein [Mycoemilia scoparia]